MMTRFLTATKPAYFSLIGGVAFSEAVGVYITIVIGSDLPKRWPVLALSVVLFALAGWLWTVLGVLMAEIRESIDSAPATVRSEQQASALINEIRRNRRLSRILIAACFSTLAAIAILPFGPLMAD